MFDNLLFLVWVVLWLGSLVGVIGDKLLNADDWPAVPRLLARLVLFAAAVACLLIGGSFLFEGISYWEGVIIVLPSLVTLVIVVLTFLLLLGAIVRLADDIEEWRMERRWKMNNQKVREAYLESK